MLSFLMKTLLADGGVAVSAKIRGFTYPRPSASTQLIFRCSGTLLATNKLMGHRDDRHKHAAKRRRDERANAIAAPKSKETEPRVPLAGATKELL